jgi:hypothetical protein
MEYFSPILMSVGVEKDLGLDLDDPLGLELAYVIQGYHGGDHTQFIGLLNFSSCRI